ncbi:MAG: class I SAM-dependent methyltransferase, partial [Bacteroidetes bacterium]|nr:class I SAM-dependent methyltransferase [Bacteroidota bacterium]
MSNFKAYSNYYDLLYKNKDYKAESNYVVAALKEFNPNIKTIIELGCGSGSHANFICQNKIELTGIERSEEMANVAKAKNIKGFNAIVADISSYPRLDKEYDAAISLFHVISYLTDNTSLINCFNITNQNLKTGGLFLFDIWFTPAVYSQKPETRVRRLEDDNTKVTRIAQSTSNATNNVVDVNFEVIIQ